MTQNEFNKRIIDELKALAFEVSLIYSGSRVPYDITAVEARIQSIQIELPVEDDHPKLARID